MNSSGAIGKQFNPGKQISAGSPPCAITAPVAGHAPSVAQSCVSSSLPTASVAPTTPGQENHMRINPDEDKTEPPSVAVNIGTLLATAAAMAAAEGHPAVITGENVQDAFEKATK
jgi:hypothetical protein